ncbi:STAS domain-containing protein [Nitrospira lenta]|uniref:STAS domain-containing protein n=1 Tax=Nitrospira lenta TaxID=1436998 RepID=A0A330LBX7_9BACT|nr:STAS domain-containing protein [Nitrospira lenta]SPP64509.1 conserved hypothetical protein [Nitrospira lenta]
MLRITIRTDKHSTIFQLEGRLAGAWVQELDRCWEASASTKAAHPRVVDLSAVTYVDAEGKGLLKKIFQAGAKLVASGCVTSSVVNEITHGG